MRTMAMLVGCILFLPSVQAGPEGPDERIEELVDEMLQYVSEEDLEVIEELLDLLMQMAGTCVGSSVSLNDSYIDHAYHQEPASSSAAASGEVVSVRTTPSGSGAHGFVLVVGTGGGCQEFYHEGDQGAVVGG